MNKIVVGEDYGKHCCVFECGMLDFLPIMCFACKKPFCKYHFQPGKHECTGIVEKDRVAPKCSICSKTIFIGAGEEKENILSQHIASGCKLHLAQRKAKKCARKGCKVRDPFGILCPFCESKYCINHHLPEVHACECLPKPEKKDIDGLPIQAEYVLGRIPVGVLGEINRMCLMEQALLQCHNDVVRGSLENGGDK